MIMMMMITTTFALGLLLIWLSVAHGVMAEAGVPVPAPPLTVPDSSSASSSNATLVFSSHCTLVSEPLSPHVHDLRQFLERDDIRKLFLSAGGARPCHTLTVSSPYNRKNDDNKDDLLKNLWKQACDRYYGPEALPPFSSNDDDNTNHEEEEDDDITIVATETSAQFPGFRIITTVVNGCCRIKLTPPSSSTTTATGLQQRILSLRHASLSPLQRGPVPTTTKKNEDKHDERVVHQFYLIADRKRWEGPKAVVWLVRKLTGGGTDPVTDASVSSSQSFHPSDTRATSQVSIVETPFTSVTASPSTPKEPINDDPWSPSPTSSFTNPTTPAKATMMYGFQIEIDCAVRVEFPKILLRLLPSSRSKVEEQGTRAVHEALLKDATSALVAVQRAWWNQQEAQQPQDQEDVESETSSSETPTTTKSSIPNSILSSRK